MPPTSKRSHKENVPGADRLQKYVGVRKVSYYYLHPNGASETLASAPKGDRQAIMEAERTARRRAADLQEGVILVGSAADLIERFRTEIAPEHYRDQSKDGLAVREGSYKNLIKFFGKMAPQTMKTIHGYQYLDARAKAGGPIRANKEMALMSTICRYAIKWGVIEENPFKDMMQNQRDRDVRAISRSQIVRFYLWSRRQNAQFQTLGCAAMFTYLTGFRAAEVRPFHTSGLTDEGVRVVGAKRKKGEDEVVKLREWSLRLRVVVTRARKIHKVERMYLFANRHGKPYTRSGWGSVWQDAMLAWIGCTPKELVGHPLYFSLLDIRPAAITTKIEQRKADAYDFAAHANPSTTHKHYDRRKIKRASATE
jgi:integrase